MVDQPWFKQPTLASQVKSKIVAGYFELWANVMLSKANLRKVRIGSPTWMLLQARAATEKEPPLLRC